MEGEETLIPYVKGGRTAPESTDLVQGKMSSSVKAMPFLTPSE
jgi:hypothetical protein